MASEIYLRVMDRVTHLVRAAVCGIGIGLVILLFLEVLSRFVFDFSIFVVNGLARMLLLWFFFLGAALALKEGSHVGLTFLDGMLEGRAKALASAIARLATVAFLALLLVGSLSLISGAWSLVEPSLGISVFWLYLSIPTGTALMLAFFLELEVRAFRDAHKGAKSE